MQIKIFPILLSLACFTQVECSKNKYTAPVPSYNYPITGIVYIKTNYENGSDSAVLSNKPVFIDTSFGTDTSRHFFSLITGSDGSFVFYVSDTTRPYRLFTACYDTSSSAFFPFYYGSILTSSFYANNPVYKITATIDPFPHNGMIIVTLDKNGNILPRVNTVLYTSPFVAVADSSFSTSWHQVVTDSLGKAYVSAIPGNLLYESAKIKISSTDSLLVKDSVINVPVTGIFYDTLILH